MMTTRCMGSLVVPLQRGDDGPLLAALPLPGAGHGWPDDRLRRNPSLKEAALAFAAVAPIGRAQRPPAASRQRPAPQRVAFEGQEQIEGDEAQTGPASVEDRRQTQGLDAAVGDEVGEERPPQTIEQKPQRPKHRRPPGEPILDEDEAFRAVHAVGRGIGRLVHGKGQHGSAPGTGLSGLLSWMGLARLLVCDRLALPLMLAAFYALSLALARLLTAALPQAACPRPASMHENAALTSGGRCRCEGS